MKSEIKVRKCTQYPLSDDPLLNRIYNAREVKSSQELDYRLSNLLTYHQLAGIELGVQLLEEVLVSQKKIVILGDYDTDGATSTALAYLSLKALGVQQVEYLIPDRFTQGYGLTVEVVQKLAELKPDLILTVDNGINHHEGVLEASRLGIKVLITDHHLVDQSLPLAGAIINPNQWEDNFDSKTLVGVGVVFYLMLAFRAHLRQKGWVWLSGEPNLGQFLDLVALGTIADSASLDYNNRILVANGINLIRRGATRLGILALLEVAKRDYRTITAEDLAFSVVPRLNAAGRLEHMGMGVECLLTLNKVRAQKLAQSLNLLNEKRKRMSEQLFKEVKERIVENSEPVCLFEEHWHQGVVGIAASRATEHFNLPALLFARGQRNLQGSARSVEGLDIRRLLEGINDRYPGLIRRFGGHAMAAGVSIEEQNFEAFRKIFLEEIREYFSTHARASVSYLIDGELTAEEINLSNALKLRKAGPFGPGFPEPVFRGSFRLMKVTILKRQHVKLTVRTEVNNRDWEAVYFNVDDPTLFEQKLGKVIEFLYKLGVNNFQQLEQVQLMIVEVLDE